MPILLCLFIEKNTMQHQVMVNKQDKQKSWSVKTVKDVLVKLTLSSHHNTQDLMNNPTLKKLNHYKTITKKPGKFPGFCLYARYLLNAENIQMCFSNDATAPINISAVCSSSCD